MIEDQTPQEPPNEPVALTPPPRRNWTAWVAAGGCVVLVCGALFVAVIIFTGP
jgi:hypothetical protein